MVKANDCRTYKNRPAYCHLVNVSHGQHWEDRAVALPKAYRVEGLMEFLQQSSLRCQAPMLASLAYARAIKAGSFPFYDIIAFKA